MSDLIVRTVFSFGFDDDSKWFSDKARMTKVIDAITSSDLGAAIGYAGSYGEQKPAKGAGAIAKAVAKGKSGSFLLLDAAEETKAAIHIAIDLDTDSLDVTLMIKGAALDKRRKTLLDTLTSIGVDVFAAIQDLATMTKGFVHPMAERVYEYPRARPPVTHPRLETSAIVDLIDARAGDELAALAAAATPPYVKRTQHGGLLVLRWIGTLADEAAVALAAGRHERWMSKAIPVRAVGPTATEDAPVPLSRKEKREPFTFFDPDHGYAYKAIIVDPAGTPDEDVWNKMVKALAKRSPDIKGIRLVAPLRDLAIKLAGPARAAGFDAVVYPDKTDHLRNPVDGGVWIDDVDPEPAAKPRR